MARLIQKFKIDVRRFSTVRTNSASVVSNTGPFDLDGSDWTLNVSIDGGVDQPISIPQAAFVDSSVATAQEMIAVINGTLVGGESYVDSDGAVVVGTNTEGTGGGVAVSGDAAGTLLAFPVLLASGGGFDSVFGSVRSVEDGTQEGTTRRREMPTVRLKCQVDRNDWGRKSLEPGGVHESVNTVFTIERSELKAKGLIDERGKPMLNVGDRVVRLLSMSGKLVESFEDPDGLWIKSPVRGGHGLKAWGDRTNRIYFVECGEDRVT